MLHHPDRPGLPVLPETEALTVAPWPMVRIGQEFQCAKVDPMHGISKAWYFD
jgi:hypothetical protein